MWKKKTMIIRNSPSQPTIDRDTKKISPLTWESRMIGFDKWRNLFCFYATCAIFFSCGTRIEVKIVFLGLPSDVFVIQIKFCGSESCAINKKFNDAHLQTKYPSNTRVFDTLLISLCPWTFSIFMQFVYSILARRPFVFDGEKVNSEAENEIAN